MTYKCKCEDRRELDERRNALKRQMKDKGLFLKVERDTVLLRNGDLYEFVIEPSVPEIEEEPVKL